MVGRQHLAMCAPKPRNQLLPSPARNGNTVETRLNISRSAVHITRGNVTQSRTRMESYARRTVPYVMHAITVAASSICRKIAGCEHQAIRRRRQRLQVAKQAEMGRATRLTVDKLTRLRSPRVRRASRSRQLILLLMHLEAPTAPQRTFLASHQRPNNL